MKLRSLANPVLLTAASFLLGTACGDDVTTQNVGGAGGSGAAGASGGSGGSGGSGAAGGGLSAMPECTGPSACSLANNCCSCLGLAPGESPPPCSTPDCTQTTCEEYGFPNLSPECAVGRCVAGLNCDHSQVSCESLPPDCDPGMTPAVDGMCWGPCVPAAECASVGSCDQCTPDDHVCVIEVTQMGLIHHCVRQPAICSGPADCACMGESVCQAPFDVCVDTAAGQISCECPTC